MLKHLRLYTAKLGHSARKAFTHLIGRLAAFWKKGWPQKTACVLAALVILVTGTMYGIARWYIASQKGPQALGASFIPAYAEYLGLNPQDSMDALINEVGVRHFRLVSYWSQLESQKGTYDFSLLDWQFAKAEAANAKISLSIGLRQPRWPECHEPDWAKAETKSQRNDDLQKFIAAVVQRYKTSPSLESYQLENEFSLKAFGECDDYDRSRLISEFNQVKSLDPKHPIIISRSVNFPTPMLSQPRPDIVGFSAYRRVWDGRFTNRYFTYPIPAWYFAFQAGVQKILTGRESIVHEMQAEAWPPNGQGIPDTSLSEQNKTMNARRLTDAVNYGRATGMREIYLWGAEYWYYRKVALHDDSLWRVAQQEFAKPQ